MNGIIDKLCQMDTFVLILRKKHINVRENRRDNLE